jgi:hypothetical protein
VRQDRRPRRVAQHHHRALGLDDFAFGLGIFVRGLDHFSVLAVGLGFELDVDGFEEGPGERRRELH